MKTTFLIMRIIMSLPILCIAVISFIVSAFAFTFRWIAYGGELVSYKKEDRATIFKIYEHLKNNQI